MLGTAEETNKSSKWMMPLMDIDGLVKKDLFIHSMHSIEVVSRNYIYIYIYIVIFGPVKPESGVIPSGQEIIHE